MPRQLALLRMANRSREDRSVAATAPATPNLGFLMIAREANGIMGGYLVTNPWGRPLEFRLSSAVQPNRVQQILYGHTLEPYICGELIGKTLVEKAAIPAGLIVTDCGAALDLRLRVDVPVVWLVRPEDVAPEPCVQLGTGRAALCCHPRFPGDVALVKERWQALDGMIDPAEPFARIREAMSEARKMGVTRAA
jgi:hypothetical protein